MTTLRALALAQLDSFVDEHAIAYSDRRNLDRGAGRHEAVSRLSAAIRFRLILEEEVLAAVLAKHSLSEVEKFVHEVCWRTYWKGWLQTNPQVWVSYLQSRDEHTRQLSEQSEASRGFGNAVHGRTGIKCFDAWVKELVSTGYLHNHSRMWFASIWIFTLKLPWQLGADFFMRHLVDADPASNTLSWRWVAGLHTPGKHYLARAENILRNTEGRFDPRGQLDENSQALSEPDFEPRRQPWRPPIPNNIASVGPRAGMLLTEEDLQAVDLVKQYSPRVVIVAREPIGRSVRNLGIDAANYVRQALAEAASAAASTLGCPLVTVETLNSRAAIAAACLEHGAVDLVTAHAPVGPTSSALAELLSSLGAQNIVLHQVFRRWDLRAWPFCSQGFFQFRERIPELLMNIPGKRVAPAERSSSDQAELAAKTVSLSNLVGKR